MICLQLGLGCQGLFIARENKPLETEQFHQGDSGIALLNLKITSLGTSESALSPCC